MEGATDYTHDYVIDRMLINVWMAYNHTLKRNPDSTNHILNKMRRDCAIAHIVDDLNTFASSVRLNLKYHMTVLAPATATGLPNDPALAVSGSCDGRA